MARMKIKLNSLHSLLMHNNQTVDPMNKFSIELKKFTSKKKKTEEDHIAISQLQWRAALYYEDGIGPVIRAEMIEACIREGAKMSKKGTHVKMGIRCIEDYIPLEYDGPKDIEGLMANDKYRDCRVGVIQRSSVLVTRPRFDRWSLTFELEYDDNIFDESELKEIITKAGLYKGIGDYRPRYGRFEPIFLN